MGISESCDTKGVVRFRTDRFHAADMSPAAAATPTLSPDSCDGGVGGWGSGPLACHLADRKEAFRIMG